MQVSGSQLTACWHVDDLKISHKSALVVTGFVAKLGQMHGSKLTASRGKAHDYLGMDLDFTREPGTMTISMIKHLHKVREEVPDVLHGTNACPAGKHLFDVRPDDVKELLPEEMASKCHRAVAQLLFLCVRARLDIQVCVLFLTTRVQAPDKDDWGGNCDIA